MNEFNLLTQSQIRSDVEDDVSDGEGIDDFLIEGWDESNYVTLGFKDDDFNEDGDHVEKHEVSDFLQPSWDAIEDLYNSNRLNEEEALGLKTKCKILYEVLLIQRRSEQKRLEEAKKFVAIIEKQKSQLNSYDVDDGILDKCEDRSEMMRLRDKMLRYSNELMVSACRQESLQATLEILREEEKILRLEVSNLQNGSVENEQTNTRLKNLDDLDQDVTLKEEECQLLRLNAVQCKERNDKKSKEIELLKENLRMLQEKLETLGPQNFKIMRKTERLKLKKSSEKEKLDELSEETKQNRLRLRNLTKELLDLESEKFELWETAEERKVEAYKSGEILRSLAVDCECSKNKEKDLLLERTQLDLKLKEKNALKKQLQERTWKLLRQFNDELRNLRKGKMALETVRSSHDQVLREHQKVSDLKRSISMRKNENKRSELIKAVKEKKEHLESQKDLESLELLRVNELLTNQEKYSLELVDTKKELQTLHQIIVSKTAERNNRAKDLLKTKQQLREAELEVKLKLNEIEDQKSELGKINSRYKSINELYNLLRAERNKLSELFVVGGQNVLELEDKVKLQSNQVLVLQSASLTKENLLQKQHLAYLASTLAAEKLRSDVSRINMRLIDLNESHGKTSGSLEFVGKSLGRCKQETTRIKEVQKSELLQKDQRMTRLKNKKRQIEKQNEKHQVLESIIGNGNVSLSFKEEEMKMLRMRLNDLKRATNIFKEKLKNKKSVEDKLMNVQIQMSQYQEFLLDLESKFIDSTSGGRIRFLDRKEPSEDELSDKLNKLAARVSKMTKEVKEKNIVYQRIFNCTKQAWEGIKTGKNESLSLAKQGSYLRSRVARTTLKIMALVAELSMRKSETIHLEQTLKDKKAELLEMEQNLERGLPPSQDVERELERESKRTEKILIRNSTQESEIDRCHNQL